MALITEPAMRLLLRPRSSCLILAPISEESSEHAEAMKIVKRHHTKLCPPDSPPSTPTTLTEESDEILESSESNHSKRELARAAGMAMTLRVKQFDLTSNLPKNNSHLAKEVHWDDLDIGYVLGKGGFSRVHVVSILPEPTWFALKFLDDKLWHQPHQDKLAMAASDLALEARLLSHLSHENIIKLHGMKGASSTVDFLNDPRGFFLVLDLLQETLHDRLERWRLEDNTRLLDRLEGTAIGITRGMEYLHSMNVAFRDLKPRNVGYCESSGVVKIFDFGLAKEIHHPQLPTSRVGTYRYMAPEVYISGMEYDLSCDVYSFGIVLWQICSLQQKYAPELERQERLMQEVIEKGLRPPLTLLKSPAKIKNLMQACWATDPNSRPSFTSIRRELLKTIATCSQKKYNT